MEEPIFDILEIEQAFPGYWRAIGRAIQDISVGDRLAIRALDENGRPIEHSIAVDYILVYGRGLPTMYRGLTGVLTLKGDHGDLIRDRQKLWRPTPSKAQAQ